MILNRRQLAELAELMRGHADDEVIGIDALADTDGRAIVAVLPSGAEWLISQKPPNVQLKGAS